MSSCLSTLKSCPKLLQSLYSSGGNVNASHTVHTVRELLQLSRNLVDLGACYAEEMRVIQGGDYECQGDRAKAVGYEETLFNRFFGRVGEIAHTFVNRYQGSTLYSYLKDFFTYINNAILDHRHIHSSSNSLSNNSGISSRNSNNSHLLQNISRIVIRYVKKAIQSNGLQLDRSTYLQIEQLSTPTQQPRPANPNQTPTYKNPKTSPQPTENPHPRHPLTQSNSHSHSILQKLKQKSLSKQKQLQQERRCEIREYRLEEVDSKCRSLGLEIIADLDYQYFNCCLRYGGTGASYELYRSSINRNKMVREFINTYVEDYKLYTIKTMNRKNKQDRSQGKPKPLAPPNQILTTSQTQSTIINTPQTYIYSPIPPNPCHSPGPNPNPAPTNSTRKMTRTKTQPRSKMLIKTATQYCLETDCYQSLRKAELELRQELISHLYAYKGKLQAVNKVNIGVVNIRMNNSTTIGIGNQQNSHQAINHSITMKKSSSSTRKQKKQHLQTTLNQNFGLNLDLNFSNVANNSTVSNIPAPTTLPRNPPDLPYSRRKQKYKLVMNVSPSRGDGYRFRAVTNRPYMNMRNIVSVPLK